MATLQTLAAELTGVLPGLSPILAESYISRAFQDICNARNWAWLDYDAAIVCPQAITAGLISITQFSNQVTASATASAALAIQDASTPSLTSMAIRFSAPNNSSQIYQIIAVDATAPAAIVLTLNRIVVEATNATASYQCYRPYITPTDNDFLKWSAVDDMVNGINVGLNYSSEYFNGRDPQRQAFGLAYYLGRYRGNDASSPAGGPMWEFWPGPTNGQVFYAQYQRRGTSTQWTDVAGELPVQISDQLILQRALTWYAYPFAKANIGHFPAMKSVDWNGLIVTGKQNYQTLLLDAKTQDDETSLKTVYNRGYTGLRRNRFGGFSGPIDARFMQSHAITW